jgi:hypothetical protein
MNCLRLSLPALTAIAMLTASGVTAQTQSGASKLVTLNVVARDSAGRAVPDLTASDISVFDNNSREGVTSLRLRETDGSHVLVILYDLMNASQASRGAVREALKTATHLPSTSQWFLYLLVEDGSIHSVRGLPEPTTVREALSQQQDIVALLDAALNRVEPVEAGRNQSIRRRALQHQLQGT